MRRNMLSRKLSGFARLDDEDEALLNTISVRPRLYLKGEDVIGDGDVPDDVHLVLSGLACRYKLMADGERQITAYLIPGDFCDLHVAILDRMDHAIGALTETAVLDVPRQTIAALLARPNISRAMRLATLVDEATLRQWIVNLGRRSAVQSLAHLFCELRTRMESVGLVENNEFSLPISQKVLADTTGLSVVHVNRSLAELRKARLLAFSDGRMHILDAEGLDRLAGFEDDYLHLAGKSANSPADHV